MPVDPCNNQPFYLSPSRSATFFNGICFEVKSKLIGNRTDSCSASRRERTLQSTLELRWTGFGKSTPRIARRECEERSRSIYRPQLSVRCSSGPFYQLIVEIQHCFQKWLFLLYLSIDRQWKLTATPRPEWRPSPPLDPALPAQRPRPNV